MVLFARGPARPVGARAPRRSVPTRARWGVTLAATAASTYALDAVATAVGLLLAASAVLSGFHRPLLLALLVCSYLVWGTGLRVSLRANADLLERTGTSTNALSKGLHDLAARRTRDRRVRRTAAAVGYVATELAKEVPYYVGAFGATLLATSVTSTHAITFLIGANVGAAGYEYGLAVVTRAVLNHRYAAFETDWVPQDYLADYYSEVEPDEHETIAFLVEAISGAEPERPVLLFGVGPTLHHVFLVAETASEIHLADYLPGNLAEIRRWIDGDPDAHDWRPFVRYTLQCEGIEDPSDEQVSRREDLTRSRITRLIQVDGRLPEPLPDRYATVVSAYCADSATRDRTSWQAFMRNIMDTVRPGGLFLTAALRRSRGYQVGGRTFPSAGVDEHDVRSVIESAWGPLTGSVEIRHLTDESAHGYSGIMLAWARRGHAPERNPVVPQRRPPRRCGDGGIRPGIELRTRRRPTV